MRITPDVCDCAEAQGVADETEALAKGMEEKAAEFLAADAQVYRRD